MVQLVQHSASVGQLLLIRPGGLTHSRIGTFSSTFHYFETVSRAL